jgi:hypothetical protein
MTREDGFNVVITLVRVLRGIAVIGLIGLFMWAVVLLVILLTAGGFMPTTMPG